MLGNFFGSIYGAASDGSGDGVHVPPYRVGYDTVNAFPHNDGTKPLDDAYGTEDFAKANSDSPLEVFGLGVKSGIGATADAAKSALDSVPDVAKLALVVVAIVAVAYVVSKVAK
jgi:hypothetical protein